MNRKHYATLQGRELSDHGRAQLEADLAWLSASTEPSEPAKPRPTYRSAATPWGSQDAYDKSADIGRTYNAAVLERLYPGCVTLVQLAEELGVTPEGINRHRVKGAYGLVAIAVTPGQDGMGRIRYIVSKEVAEKYIAAFKATFKP